MNDEYLRKSCEVADEMAEQYRLYARSDNPCKSMDDLIHVFRECFNDGREISIEDLDIPQRADGVARGVMLVKGNVSEIYIVPDSEFKNRRFVTCKELFQADLDDPAMWSMQIMSHIEELMAAGVFDEDPSPSVISEFLAEVAAMQFLYPYDERKKDLLKIRNRELTYKQISDHYGIPLYYVELYLSDTYMENLRSSHTMRVVAAASAE